MRHAFVRWSRYGGGIDDEHVETVMSVSFSLTIEEWGAVGGDRSLDEALAKSRPGYGLFLTDQVTGSSIGGSLLDPPCDLPLVLTIDLDALDEPIVSGSEPGDRLGLFFDPFTVDADSSTWALHILRPGVVVDHQGGLPFTSLSVERRVTLPAITGGEPNAEYSELDRYELEVRGGRFQVGQIGGWPHQNQHDPSITWPYGVVMPGTKWQFKCELDSYSLFRLDPALLVRDGALIQLWCPADSRSIGDWWLMLDD
jgi:hypothetical protein